METYWNIASLLIPLRLLEYCSHLSLRSLLKSVNIETKTVTVRDGSV